jgi:CelD/BcsL family acetyltransferase involved in cellulose biosynthesis
VKQFRLIESYEEFNTLADAWNELVLATPLAHVYMRHEWFDTWMSTRDHSPQLAILTGWRDGQLVSIAPFQRTKQQMKVITATLLKFLQSPISPRCNFIAKEKADADELFASMSTIPDWDLLIAENMESNQPITEWYSAFLNTQNESEYRVQDGRQSPFLDISGTWDSYLKSLHRDRRTFINSECLNRLKRAENARIERCNSSTNPEYILSTMFDISSRSWKQETGSAISQVPNQKRFYEQFTKQALAHGWIDIRVIHIAGKPVGFDYYLTHQDNYSLIRTDFDSELKYYHPGENLKIDLLQDLFSQNRPAQLDMGGDSSLYKQKWASGVRNHTNITVANSTLLAKAIMLGKYQILPALKRPFQRISN